MLETWIPVCSIMIQQRNEGTDRYQMRKGPIKVLAYST